MATGTATRRDIFRRVLAQGWGYRWLLLLSVLLAAGSGALSAYLLTAGKRLFDAWSRVESASEMGAGSEAARALLDGAVADMQRQAWILVVLAPVAAAAAYAAWVAGQHLAARVMRDLRARFVAHLVRLDLDFHAELSRGDLLARMSADLGSLLGLQQALYGKLLQFPLQILAVVITLFIFAWQLASVLFLVLLPLAAVVARLLKRTRSRSQRARESLAQNLDAFEQITAGIRVVKTIGSAEREVARYAGTNQRYYGDTLRVARARAASNAATEGFIFLFFALALLGGAWMFRRDLIEPSTLLMVLGALGLIVSALRNTQRAWGDVVEQLPAAERIFAILDRAPALAAAPGAPPAPPPRTAITCTGVRFRYPGSAADVLQGLDLAIPVGQTVALVGESGGGKTTVLDLIPRLRDVTGGTVAWDGVDVRAYTPDSLIAHCAIVSQEAFLFNASVRDNIRYGRPEATDAEIEQAARRAHVHDAILALEGGHGYDTVVGDRGGRLSGGQRQRIAIARALLRDAPVLLLDEPTSALDAASEAHVQAALHELMRGRTVVVVAHRLATVRHADRIHVLAGKSHPTPGIILESGTHAELVARDGAYAGLARQQSLA